MVNEQAVLSVIDQVPPLDQAKGAAAPVVRELRLQRAGQRVTYQAVATRAKAGGVLLVLRNISAMAATVQMKTDFVANASHELRTPIAAIKVAFETLQDVYADDPEQTAKCVTIIAEHLRRLEEMLTDLLDLSRVESPDMKPQIAAVAMPDLVAHVRATMGPLARQKNVELLFDSNHWAGGPEFNSDRRLLNLVLKNLVENSIKFTPAGGHVTVGFARESPTEPAGMVRIQVVDTGIGISPEHQERVFERFYQVNSARSGAAGRGTGLGLAIVKHAMHALNGDVSLSSSVGVGTRVVCELPDVQINQDEDAASAPTTAS